MRAPLKYGITLAVVAVFGCARLNFEQRLSEEHRENHFHRAKLDLRLREQIGQFGFIAALSGFRALVADMLWIQGQTAWERTEWSRMALIFNNVVALQPRALMFWEMSAWHMAWNASVAAREDPKQPREALRIQKQREYFRIGEDFLLRGIENNPDRYKLYEQLAILYRDKFEDHCKSATYWEKTAAFPDAPMYAERFAAYELARCPGNEAVAYKKLRELYLKGPDERLPTMLTLIRELQAKLAVPESEKIAIPERSLPKPSAPTP